MCVLEKWVHYNLKMVVGRLRLAYVSHLNFQGIFNNAVSLNLHAEFVVMREATLLPS